MPREIMDVFHQLGSPLLRRCAADTPSQRNADAGRLSLEGPQHQCLIRQNIKARPVQPLHPLPEQGCRIGKIGNHVGHALGKRRKVPAQGIKVRFKFHKFSRLSHLLSILAKIAAVIKKNLRMRPDRSRFLDFFSGYIPLSAA